MIATWTRALILTLALSGAALAQSPQDADSLIEQAKALRGAGDDAAAYELYVRAYGISRTPRAAGQLALCEYELNRWVDSELHLQEALRAGNDPWVRRNRPILVDMLGKVKLRLARIEITGRPEGAEVEVAGRAIGRLPLPGPLRVPAGEIFVRVAAPGFRTLRRSVIVQPEELAQVTVELEAGQTDSAAGPAPLPPQAFDPGGAGAGSPYPGVADAGTPRAGGWQRQAGWIGAGVAGALAAAGAGGLLVRYLKTKEFNDHQKGTSSQCNNALANKGGGPCAGYLEAAARGKTFGLVSFAGAGLVAVVSGILLATSPPAPRVDAAGQGALLTFRF
jgi:hypothetical protein